MNPFRQLFRTDQGFVFYSGQENLDLATGMTGIEAWTSADGRTWENQGPPEFVTDTFRTGMIFDNADYAPSGRAPELVAVVEHSTGGIERWESDDGINWVNSGRSPATTGKPMRPSSG